MGSKTQLLLTQLTATQKVLSDLTESINQLTATLQASQGEEQKCQNAVAEQGGGKPNATQRSLPLEKVLSYAEEKGYPQEVARFYHSFYEDRGWTTTAKLMTCWKSTLDKWCNADEQAL